MKRDWDLIRDILIEVEALDPAVHGQRQYGPLGESKTPDRDAQAALLWKAGFIDGTGVDALAGTLVIATGLTWQGHDLLETMRSEPVWDRIKATAESKGIELTFDAVKTLGKFALEWVVNN